MERRAAIVTGAASGIGLACATRLASDGMAVALLDRDEAAGEKAAQAITTAGGEAMFLRCDVTSRDDIKAAVHAAEKAFGTPTVLVNNAGINRPADFLDFDPDDFDLILRTNLTSMFLMAQAVTRRMVAAGKDGAIVNMSSGNAVMTGPKAVAYAASKGGIASMTAAMALALAPHNIRVNAAAPGTIMTEMTRGRLWDDVETRTTILSRTPMGKFGTPEDVAGLVAYLVGPDSAFMTGQFVVLDGGRNVLNYTVPVPPQT